MIPEHIITSTSQYFLSAAPSSEVDTSQVRRSTRNKERERALGNYHRRLPEGRGICARLKVLGYLYLASPAGMLLRGSLRPFSRSVAKESVRELRLHELRLMDAESFVQRGGG